MKEQSIHDEIRQMLQSGKVDEEEAAALYAFDRIVKSAVGMYTYERVADLKEDTEKVQYQMKRGMFGD